jgi:hypothetical protein
MKRTVTIWFVKCPADGHYQFSMHPHIWWSCSCGVTRNDEARNQPAEPHTLHEAAYSYRTSREIEPRLAAAIADPESHFVQRAK